MERIDQIIQQHAEAIQHLRTGLACNFDMPAQCQINRAFASMGIARFDHSGDVWEQIVARQNGWEYTKPPRHLIDRWASY
jgi:hypothetical protein